MYQEVIRVPGDKIEIEAWAKYQTPEFIGLGWGLMAGVELFVKFARCRTIFNGVIKR